jgi:cytochrome b561
MSDRATMGKINSPLTLGGNGRWSTTSRRPQTAFVYDRGTIVLHWCTALLVGALWILGQTIDDFPAGPWRVDARSFHIALGVTVAVVLVIRVTWRDRGVGALRPDRTGRLDRLAAIGHWALYALAILAVASGLTNALVRGDNIFNLFSLLDLSHGDRDLRKLIGALHGWVANTLIIAVAAHALLALFHHYVLRDGVMRRMLPDAGHARDAAGLR